MLLILYSICLQCRVIAYYFVVTKYNSPSMHINSSQIAMHACKYMSPACMKDASLSLHLRASLLVKKFGKTLR